MNKPEKRNQEIDPKQDRSYDEPSHDELLNDQANSEAEQPQTKIDDKSDYDGGYKNEFANKAHFLHFLKKYVKADWAMDLNEDDVKLCDREFLLEDYQKRHADLVYQIRLNGETFFVYLIMELQSEIDYTMPFRFLTLIFALLSQYFASKKEKGRERKGFRLPAVIPILFYNGKRPWNAEKEFCRYIKGHERFGANILNFEYIVVDLNKIEPADLRSGNSILDYILLLDKDKKKRSVINILSAVKEQIGSFSTSDKTGFLKWLQYVLLPAMGDEYKEQALQIIAAMEGDGKKMIHHIQVVQQEEYQRYWDDGVAHGIKQGITQGITQGHAAGLTEGLTQGLSQGLSKGQERMNRLIELLVQDNRQDDLLRSVNDPAFQEELMREYGLEQ